MIIRKPIPSKLGVEPLKGQTLIEVLVAMGAGVVVLVAMVSVVLSALSNAQFSKNQNLATQYAQQGMEIVRDLKNRSGWTNFNNYNGFYCLPESGNLAQGSLCGNNIAGFFGRRVNFENIAGVGKRVTMTVSFTDNKGEHKSDLISIFTNWE